MILMILTLIGIESFKNDPKKSILIGDSNVNVISHSTGFPPIKIGPHKGGITSNELISMLDTSPKDYHILTSFVAIGTNDCYKVTDENSLLLMKKIKYHYPNVKKVYIIWGSLGWGGVKNKTACDQKIYYDRYVKNGFIPINPTPISYDYKNCSYDVPQHYKDAGSAHEKNSKAVLYIVSKIKILI